MIEPWVDRKVKLSSVRILRKVTLTLLPFMGVLVVVGAVFWVRELRLQIVFVVCGLLLVELGVWKSARTILPSERKFDALRFEVEAFIRLVRQLNTAALALQKTPSHEHQQTFEDIRGAMQQAVERMVEVAGKTDAEIVKGIASTVAQANHQDVDSRTVA